MDTIISGLVLASVSGAVFLAYKHPLGYAKLRLPLLIVSTMIFICIVFWNLGAQAAYIKLIPFLKFEQTVAANSAFQSAYVPFGWLIGIYFGVTLFINLLSLLPKLLEDEKQQGSESKEKEDEVKGDES